MWFFRMQILFTAVKCWISDNCVVVKATCSFFKFVHECVLHVGKGLCGYLDYYYLLEYRNKRDVMQIKNMPKFHISLNVP